MVIERLRGKQGHGEKRLCNVFRTRIERNSQIYLTLYIMIVCKRFHGEMNEVT